MNHSLSTYPKDDNGKTQGFGRFFSPVIFPLGCSFFFLGGGGEGISNNPEAGFAKIRHSSHPMLPLLNGPIRKVLEGP